MQLQRLYLKNFRNYREAVVEFGPGINFIYGRNGQGKTTLVEAIYFLIAGRSFRTNRPADLIGKEGPSFYLEAHFIKHGVEQKLKTSYGPEGRSLIFNNTPYPSWVRLLGTVCGVIMVSDDSSLVKGTPSERRYFLDMQLAQSDPLYVQHLARYKKAMKQRNYLLRGKEDSTIHVWEEEMAQSASYIAFQRYYTVKDLAKKSSLLHPQIGEAQNLELRYVPRGVREDHFKKDNANLATHYLQQFQQQRARDMEAGTTLLGPHRDDISIFLAERLAGDFASEGQQKSCVTTLRLAEWQRLSERLTATPLMMVDDINSCLDTFRRNHLLSQLTRLGQVFITSIEDCSALLYSLRSPLQLIHIEEGLPRNGQNGQ